MEDPDDDGRKRGTADAEALGVRPPPTRSVPGPLKTRPPPTGPFFAVLF